LETLLVENQIFLVIGNNHPTTGLNRPLQSPAYRYLFSKRLPRQERYHGYRAKYCD
jgi:hypothetical protein